MYNPEINNCHLTTAQNRGSKGCYSESIRTYRIQQQKIK